MTEAATLFKNGQLSEAIDSLTNAIKAKFDDNDARNLLIELLCVQGDFERADAQLNIQAKQSPEIAVNLSMIRHLVRAANARKEFFEKARLPEFIDTPDDVLTTQLKAFTELKADNHEQAAKLTSENDAKEQTITGKCNGSSFKGIRDLDDRTAYCIELLAPNGNYYWLAFPMVKSITFSKPKTPSDLVWRQAQFELANEVEQTFLVPATYYHKKANDKALLGKTTEWTEKEGFTTGIGQRMWLVGDEVVPIMEIEEIKFD